jgi:DNA polymerase beta
MDTKGIALVTYTGDAEFCKHLQSKARERGCKLNSKGLWRLPDISQFSEDVEEEWKFVPTFSERDVFENLNEEWVEPDKRNFNDLLAKKRKK